MSRSTRPRPPKRRRTPSGSVASPGTVTMPSAESSATGPPWNSWAGGVTYACHGGSTASTSASSGLVEHHTLRAVVAVVQQQHDTALEHVTAGVRGGDKQLPGEEGLHTGHSRPVPRRAAGLPQLGVRPARGRSGAGTAEAARAARWRRRRAAAATRALLRPAVASLLALEQPAHLAVRDRHAARRAGPGLDQAGVAGGRARRDGVDAGVAGEALHAATLVRQGQGDDRARLAGAGGAAGAVQVVLVVGRRVDVQDQARRRRRGCRGRRRRWRPAR